MILQIAFCLAIVLAIPTAIASAVALLIVGNALLERGIK
jgi:hypothetical protein